MDEVIRDVVPLAVAVAISPLPMAGLILVLMSRRGVSNGWAFLGGWLSGLALLVIGVIALIQGGDMPAREGPRPVISWIRICLGLVLLVISARSWMRRGMVGENPEAPSWMKTVDQFTALKSLLLGFALVILNLKNLPLSIEMAALVARRNLPAGEEASCVVIFLIVSSIGLFIPVIVAILGGDEARAILERWKRWLGANNSTIISVIFLFLGIYFVVKGVMGLG